MFRNLDAEQARKRLTNSDVAKVLGVSRVTYERKKKNGEFTASEIRKLLILFSCTFEYLFEPDDETAPA